MLGEAGAFIFEIVGRTWTITIPLTGETTDSDIAYVVAGYYRTLRVSESTFTKGKKGRIWQASAFPDSRLL